MTARTERLLRRVATLVVAASAAPLALAQDAPGPDSDRGPVVVPGDPDASELYRRVAGLATPRMPFDGPPWLDDDPRSGDRVEVRGVVTAGGGVRATRIRTR